MIISPTSYLQSVRTSLLAVAVVATAVSAMFGATTFSSEAASGLTCSLHADKTTVSQGGSVTFSWAAKNSNNHPAESWVRLSTRDTNDKWQQVMIVRNPTKTSGTYTLHNVQHSGKYTLTARNNDDKRCYGDVHITVNGGGSITNFNQIEPMQNNNLGSNFGGGFSNFGSTNSGSLINNDTSFGSTQPIQPIQTNNNFGSNFGGGFGNFGSTNSGGLINNGNSFGPTGGQVADPVSYDDDGIPASGFNPIDRACPLTGGVIVDYGTDRMIANANNRTQKSESVTIPAGTYNITYYSYDGYTGRENAKPSRQDQEQWNLILRNGSGGTITQFGPTQDVAEGSDFADRRGTFANGVTINQTVRTVVAQHVLHPGSNEPHSVVPRCVKFEKVVETPPATPSCPFNGANVYQFDGTRLLADRGPTQTTANVSLAAGKYAIEYYSYDTYASRPSANLSQQNEEQWNLILRNAAGGTIAQFGPTKDVPDGVVLGEVTGVFTTGTDINQRVASMMAQHKLHPSDKDPHSVAPGCVKFTKIDEPEPEAPFCELNASPMNITAGEQVTFTWNTENAALVTFQNIAVAEDGSTVRTPNTSRTFTLRVLGDNGQIIECKKPVTVTEKPEEPKLPTCDMQIDATVSSFQGEERTVTWTTDNATMVTINGVTVALDGSLKDWPWDDKVYSLLAKNSAGMSVQCQVHVNVPNPTEEPKAPTCDMHIDATTSSFKGEERTVTWTTSDATMVTVNGEDVALNGSLKDWPWEDKTYSLIAKNDQGDQVDCQVSVTVDNPSTPPSTLSCELDVDANVSSYKGEERVFTWTTDGATSATLNGESVSLQGTTKDWPWEDKTYRLLAYNAAGEECVSTEFVDLPVNPGHSY